MVLEEIVITPELVAEYSVFSERPEGVGLLEACSESPVVFAKHMLGLELYTWQKMVCLDLMRAISDPSAPREFVVLTSRQIGKTTLSAVVSLWVSVFNKLPSGVERWSPVGVVSITDDQAKKVLREIKKYVRLGDHYCTRYSRAPDDFMSMNAKGQGCLSKLLDADSDNNKKTMTFKVPKVLSQPDGSLRSEFGDHLLVGCKANNRLECFPPTQSVLGNTFALLYQDECGRGDKFTDEAHYEFLKPTGKAYNAIYIYTSTAWQPSGFFYEMCDPEDLVADKTYKRYCFTIEAIMLENPEQYEAVIRDVDKMRLEGRKDEVERAYYCRFVKGAVSYFEPKKVDEMFKEYRPYESFAGACDIGVDFGGQVKSKTSVTVSALVDGRIVRLYERHYPVGEDDTLMQDLEFDVMKRFPAWQRIIPDDCPAGYFRIKQMVAKGWNVQPMNFRTWKVKKYGAFRAKLNQGLVDSYLDDLLKVEMKAIEFANGAQNSVISAPRGYTDDLIDSFVLSAFFFVEEEEGGYRFLRRAEPRSLVKARFGVKSGVVL